MRYTYDAEVDALVVVLQPGCEIARTVEVDQDRHVDLDPVGQVVQVEFLNASLEVRTEDIIDRFNLWDYKPLFQEVANIQPHLRPLTPM
jgi:uncharacterized protein YuzE